MAIVTVSNEMAKALNSAADIRNALIYLVQNVLVRGDCDRGLGTTGDYGLIPYCGEKPVLFKQGAEKLAQFFGLRVILRKTSEMLEKDFVHYEFEATIYGKTPGLEMTTHTAIANSEEPGIAKSIEKTKATPRGYAHNIACRAEKRAYVGGVVKALAATQFFAWEQTGMDALPVDDSPYDGLTLEVEPINTQEAIKGLAKDLAHATGLAMAQIQELLHAAGLPTSSQDMSWDHAKQMQVLAIAKWATNHYLGMTQDRAIAMVSELPPGTPHAQIAMINGKLQDWSAPAKPRPPVEKRGSVSIA